MSSATHFPLAVSNLIEEIRRTSTLVTQRKSSKDGDDTSDEFNDRDLLELRNASSELVSALEGPAPAAWRIAQAVCLLHR